MPDIDFGRISESLNEKSDRDLHNVDSLGKDTSIGWGIPDYANEIEIGAEATYTCPDNGWLCIYTNTGGWVQYTSNKIPTTSLYRPFHYGCLNAPSSTAGSLIYPVEKNEILTKGNGAGNFAVYFVPCKK